MLSLSAGVCIPHTSEKMSELVLLIHYEQYSVRFCVFLSRGNKVSKLAHIQPTEED